MATASPFEPLPLRVLPHEVPPELSGNPVVEFLMTMTPEQERSLELHREVAELYGGDADRELADLEAGRHPTQRRRV